MFIVVNRTTNGIISVLDTDDMKVDKFKEYELIRLIESHSIHIAGFYMKQGLHCLTVKGEDCGYVNWKCASVYGKVIVPRLNLNVYNEQHSFTGLQQTLLRAADCSENRYSKSILQSFLYDIYQYKINGKDTFIGISLRNREVWGSFLRDSITNDITIVHYKDKVIFTDGDLCVFINKESLSPSVNKRGELAKLTVLNTNIGSFDPSTRVCLLHDFRDKSLIVGQPLKYKLSGFCAFSKLHIKCNDAVFVFDNVSSRSTIDDFFCSDVDTCKKFFSKFFIKESCVCPLGALFYLSNKTSANIEIIKSDDIESQYESLKSDFDRFFSNNKDYNYFIQYRKINYFRQVNKNLTNLGYPECINLSDYRLDSDYDFINDSAKFCNKSNITEILNILGLTDRDIVYKIFNHYVKDDCRKLEYVSGSDYASNEFYYKTLIPISGKKFIGKIMRAYSLHNEIEKLFKLKLTCYYNMDWRSSNHNHICFSIPVSKLPFCSEDSTVEICTIKDCDILKKVLDSLYGIYITDNKFKCKIYGMERNIVRKESVVTIGILSGDKSELLDIPNLKVKEN